MSVSFRSLYDKKGFCSNSAFEFRFYHGSKAKVMARTLFTRTIFLGLCLGWLGACNDQPPTVTAPTPGTTDSIVSEQETQTGTADTEAPTAESTVPDLDTTLQDIEESEGTISTLIEKIEQTSDTQAEENSVSAVQADVSSTTDTSPALTNQQEGSSQPGVVWKIETDNVTVTNSQATIPVGQDPSLAADALAAAFALAREKRSQTEARLDDPDKPETIPPKSEGNFRIALMLPSKGAGQKVGRHIREGAELALFKLGGDNIDMIFLDSDNPERAAQLAASNGADLILGPVFGERARRVGAALGPSAIPVLTFSNDITAAGGNVLLLGQTPEQEIETVLAQALMKIKPNPDAGRSQLAIAIISQDKTYGQRISNHANTILNDAGIPPVANVTLDSATLASEDRLRQQIRSLTSWVPPSSEGEIRPPNFDIVILAGDQAFSLRVAPVLAWYDLDPEKVRYLGTSLWASPAILQEPSLRGGWFAAPPATRETLFESLWRETGKPVSNRYTMIGFDAAALASTLARKDRSQLKSILTQNAGFAGFSGMFRLLPDGRNIRLLDVRGITSDGSEVIAVAPERF